MALEVTSLAELDQTTIDTAYDYAAQLMAEKQPNIEARRGVLGSLVTGLEAIMGAAYRTEASRLRRSQSLKAITEDPALADNDLVDNVISTVGLARRPAAAATGEVTIVLDSLVAVTISAGAVFTANGKEFTSNATYAARTAAANVLEDTDRLIQQISADRYAFTIYATASETGAESLLKKDTLMVPSSAPSGFVTAYATSDFTGAENAQTNEELMAIMAQGLAARTYSNRYNINAMIRLARPPYAETYNADFATISALSIVGMGDVEMQRDQHWLFPVSGGGRSDVYLRSQALPQAKALTKTATLVEITTNGGIWQFSLGRDEVPGFYRVSKILVSGSAVTDSGYEVVADARGLDLTGDIYIPDLATAAEGAYSRYQTTTIRFLDTDTNTTDLTPGETQAYDITVEAMPLVSELQAYLGDRDVGSPLGDVLVRAAVPCYLSLSCTVQRRRGDVTVDTTSIANALAAYVNATGFTGRLYASDLLGIITPLLPSNTSVGALDMFGRILQPNQAWAYVRSSELLILPDNASNGVTARTTVFFLDPADVAISVESVSIPAI